MAKSRKAQLQHCPECGKRTAHEVVTRTYQPARGMIPGVAWTEKRQRQVMRCLKCKNEAKPQGNMCEVCGGFNWKTKWTRHKGNIEIRGKKCRVCGNEGYFAEKRIRVN